MKKAFSNIIAVSIFLISNQALAQTLEPGLWTSKASLHLNGIPLPDSEDEECITKGQTKDMKSTIEKALKKKGCELTKWILKNEKLSAALVCKNKDVDAKGELKGSVTKKSYDLKAEAKGKYKGAIPATADIKLTGQWTKKCE